jgi:hypothetical protein
MLPGIESALDFVYAFSHVTVPQLFLYDHWGTCPISIDVSYTDLSIAD